MGTPIENAMKFIYATSWKGSVFGLSRITELLKLLGEPQKKLKFAHVAGTNGKGSTAAMLARVLKEAGYKTGLYTSPYIHQFNEMLQINGVPISDDDIISLTDDLKKFTPQMVDAPTQFEIITAMAVLYFKREKCDIVIFEVGMGGRLDSTNVIETPEAAVITAIGLDHKAQLGDTVEKIAAEKAGIIKRNGAVICHPQVPSVENVIRLKCDEMNAAVIFAEKNPLLESINLPLIGEHQLNNASVVIKTVDVLRKRGWGVSDEALKSGLENTRWHGRFEILRTNPHFIVDVAHNPQGIEATLSTLIKMFPDKLFIFIFGVLADKDYEKMSYLLIRRAKRFILVTPESPRALPAVKLKKCIKKQSRKFFSGTFIILNGDKIPVTVSETVEKGAETALQTAESGDIICALGSFPMIGKIRGIFKNE